jgi:hypothetical protein
MTSDPSPPSRRKGPKLNSAEAQARLADALRENLKRRKSQQRAKAEGRDADDGGPKGGGGGGKS